MTYKDVMTPAQREAEARKYEAGAEVAKRQAGVAQAAASANPTDPDTPVVSAIFTNIAREWDNLATYYAGKAAGFRQE